MPMRKNNSVKLIMQKQQICQLNLNKLLTYFTLHSSTYSQIMRTAFYHIKLKEKTNVMLISVSTIFRISSRKLRVSSFID